MKIHIVQKGDTLWKIAKKYGVNFEELKKMNSQLSNPDMIMPGMKVKVPTSGGMIKKETPTGHSGVHHHVKKEMPIAEHPFAKEQPKPLPIVEAPIKEAPIKKEVPVKKEAPKAPYTPKMPLPVIPEIDINQYYTVNMANMTVQQPPQPPPPPVMPEVKEVPKQEVPVMPAPMPVPLECPPEPMPYCEPECVPITPVMPGTGFCPPMSYPVDPVMPYHDVPVPEMPMATGMMAPNPGPVPAPGAGYIPPHFEDESSSFMPQMSTMASFPGAGPMGGAPVQPPYLQQGVMPGGPAPGPYQAGGYEGYSPGVPSGYPTGGYPGYTGASPGYMGGAPGYPGASPGYMGGAPGYPGASPGYMGGAPGYPGAVPGYSGAAPGYPGGSYQGYPETYTGYQAGGYPQARYQTGVYHPGPAEYQTGYPSGAYPGYPGEYGVPRNDHVTPGPGDGQQPAIYPYAQAPYGYPQMGPAPQMMGGPEYESTDMAQMGAQAYPVQTGPIPVSTGGDCGCGAPPAMAPSFVPTTPPVYMAPYTDPMNTAQPPFMNPYGIGPMGSPYGGYPRNEDESNDSGS